MSCLYKASILSESVLLKFLAQFQRFRLNAENYYLVRTFAELFRQVDNSQDIRFVKGEVRHFFYGLDISRLESFDCPRLVTHFSTVDDYGLFAVCD